MTFFDKQKFRKIVKQTYQLVQLSTRLSKTQCCRHTSSENFGPCLNMYLFQVYSLLSSQVFRAQMMAGCWPGYSYAWSHWGPLRTKVNRNVRARCNRSAGSSLNHNIKGVKIQVSLHNSKIFPKYFILYKFIAKPHIYWSYLFRLKFEGFKKQYKISTKI